MLKLMVDQNIQDSIVKLRWCIERDTLEELRIRGAKKAYLLLAIISGDAGVEHLLIPLEQMEEYIQLRRPGENKIFGTIVWSTKGSYELWKKYLRQEDNQYVTDLVYVTDLDEKYEFKFCPPYNSIGKAELSLVVPKELFAKKPRDERWVNFWFESKPKDQCQFRRRRILAYTIQPPMVLLWVSLKITLRWIIVITLLTLGFWFNADEWNPKTWKSNWDFRALFHPWRMDFLSLFSENFLRLCSEYKAIVIFDTVYLLIPFMIVKTLCKVAGIGWKYLTKSSRRIFRIVYRHCGGFFRPFGNGFGRIGAAWNIFAIFLKKQIPWIEPKKREEQTEMKVLPTYQLLLCENALKVEPAKAAPFRYRIYLRYQDLKSKVCKPFTN